MKKLCLILAGTLIFAITGLAVPSSSPADPKIQVSHTTYDFGNVEVDTSVTAMITISNVGGQPLFVQNISLQSGNDGFTITSPPSLSVYIGVKNGAPNYISVDITFLPTATDDYQDTLVIVSNDPVNPIFDVLLEGVGIEEQSVTIDDILDFFDASVEAGTLEGRGRGWLSKLRLHIMKWMLKIADEYIEKDQIEYACFILKRIYERCDGEAYRRDFVKGESAPEFASMISELICSLECKGCPIKYSAILKYYQVEQDNWIEIKLQDEDGNLVPFAKYEIIYPDGNKREGTLDGDGTAHESLTSTGPIEINFPDLSPGSWEKKLRLL